LGAGAATVLPVWAGKVTVTPVTGLPPAQAGHGRAPGAAVPVAGVVYGNLR